MIDRHVVLGLGDRSGRDAGIGLHALSALRRRLGPRPLVELVEGGVPGLGLLPLVEQATHLLVLDAVDAGTEPGMVVDLHREEIPLYTGMRLPGSEVTFQEVLALAHLRGHLPERLHLIGVQPGSLGRGTELSPAVRAALPMVVDRAETVLVAWGFAPHHTPA